jgi:hypothetical protein
VAARSTHRGRFSDESFRLRDIQFNQPQIPVDPSAPREEIRQIDGTFRVDGTNLSPAIGAVDPERAFQASDVPAATANHKKQRAAIRVTPVKDRGEISIGLRPAEDRGGFEPARQSLAVHG